MIVSAVKRQIPISKRFLYSFGIEGSCPWFHPDVKRPKLERIHSL